MAAAPNNRPAPDNAPAIADVDQLTPEVLAAAADHSERRARALIAAGLDQDAAIAQAADEAILVARRTAQLARRARTLLELVEAYDHSTYRLLRDLGDHLGLSLAYVDRETVDAHVERTLSDVEWAAVAGQFTALDFDEHVGDHGSFRTDWIESVLDKAGVPGYGYTTEAWSTTTIDDSTVGGQA
jgi:hypothetical protein